MMQKGAWLIFFINVLYAGDFNFNEKCGPATVQCTEIEECVNSIKKKIKCLFEEYPQALIKELRNKPIVDPYARAFDNANETERASFWDKVKKEIPRFLMKIQFKGSKTPSTGSHVIKLENYSARWKNAVGNPKVMIDVLHDEVQYLRGLLTGNEGAGISLNTLLRKFKPDDAYNDEANTRIVDQLSQSALFRKDVHAFQLSTKLNFDKLITDIKDIAQEVRKNCYDEEEKLKKLPPNLDKEQAAEVKADLVKIGNDFEDKLNKEGEKLEAFKKAYGAEIGDVDRYFALLKEKFELFKNNVNYSSIKDNLITKLHQFGVKMAAFDRVSTSKYQMNFNPIIITYS